MNRHLIGYLSMAVIVLAACSSGPPPQPVAEDRPPSGEDTAQSAAEASEEPREAPLYATSRPGEPPPEDVEDEELTDDKIMTARDEPVTTVYVDDEGRIFDEDGDELTIDAIDELTDEDLEGRVIEIEVSIREDQPSFESTAALADVALEAGAFITIVEPDDAPDASPKEPDELDDE